MQTVVGAFPSKETAEDFIPKLLDEGFDQDAIGVMWRDKNATNPEEVEVVSYEDHHGDAGSEAGKGLAGGAIGGAATGAGTMLLASAGLALIPGIGAFLAVGTLAATAGAAAVGAIGGGVTGGLVGALLGATDDGATKVTEKQTRYRQVLENDGLLVTVESDDDTSDEVARRMAEAGATDVSVVSQAELDGGRHLA